MHRDTVMMVRRGDALIPADDAAKIFGRIKDGQKVGVKINRRRSVPQNSRYWKILDCVIQATGRWRTPEELHLALKVATSNVDVVRLVDGRLIKVPGSTSFEEMSADEFQTYSEAAFRVIEDEILDGMGIDELLAHADGTRRRRAWEGENAIEGILASGTWGGD